MLRNLCALSLALVVLSGCSGRQTSARTGGGGERLDLKQAQAGVDFVVLTPSYLPTGAKVGKALVVPEQMVGKYLLPNEVAMELGAGLSVWEMPDGAVPLPGPGEPVGLGDRVTGWLSTAVGLGRVTLEWESAGTRIGLSGNVDRALLLRIARSFRPGVSKVAPRPVSARRARMAPGLARPPMPFPPGGIGAPLARGAQAIVLDVYPGLPADRAGIKRGDQVIAVDGRPVAGGPSDDTVRRARGPVGSRVTLTIRPRGQETARTITLTRVLLPVLQRTRVSVKEAQAAIHYPLLVPTYLPQGFRLAEVNLDTWEPNPAGLQPEAQILYDGPLRAVLVISLRPASAAWPLWTPARGAQPVTVGRWPALVAASRRGAVLLQGQAGATAVRLFAMGMDERQVLQVAGSLRPAGAAK
jgi:hypothetical protein